MSLFNSWNILRKESGKIGFLAINILFLFMGALEPFNNGQTFPSLLSEPI
jgi:hypothetical protein